MAAPSGGFWTAVVLAAAALKLAAAVSEPTTVPFDVRPGGVVHSFSQDVGPGNKFTCTFTYASQGGTNEREYEKIKSQLEGLEESVRDRCKKEFTDLMIEMEDQTNDVHEAGIPTLDYKTYTDRVFFLPSKDGDKDVMITGKLDIPESRRPIVEQALYQFSNLLNSKSFLINFIHTLENQREFSARAKVYFASLLTVALHGKLEYYTDIMRTLFLELSKLVIVAKAARSEL